MLKNTFLHIPGIGILGSLLKGSFGNQEFTVGKISRQIPQFVYLNPRGMLLPHTLKNLIRILNLITQIIFQIYYRVTSNGGFSLNSETQLFIWILKQPDWKDGEMK
jgi:hypothetical protein